MIDWSAVFLAAFVFITVLTGWPHMIYQWFKRNRPLPAARDVAAAAHRNRNRKLQSILADITARIDKAIKSGNRRVEYRLDGDDGFILAELLERLRIQGYLATSNPPPPDEEPEDDDIIVYGYNITLSWLPPKGQR